MSNLLIKVIRSSNLRVYNVMIKVRGIEVKKTTVETEKIEMIVRTLYHSDRLTCLLLVVDIKTKARQEQQSVLKTSPHQ
jgi:hypothetical protein